MECVNHPGKEAAGNCIVCAKPFCHACLIEMPDGTLFCRPDAACGTALVRKGPSGLAVLSMILAIAGITNCLTGVAGMILGIVELDKIKKGQSSPEGRRYAKWAVIIGAIITALFFLYLIFVFSTPFIFPTRK